jgi:uncharacterized repeat protein (TIGR03847 family)
MADYHQIYDPDDVLFFTVGKPGKRTFYFSVDKDSQQIVLKMEKQQVGALSDSLRKILPQFSTQSIKQYEPPKDFEPLWTVGTIGVKYDTATNSVIIIFQQLTEDPEQESSVLEVIMDSEQAAQLAKLGVELVEQGRPICIYCGGPIDEQGHICPRSNGHRPVVDDT